MANINFNAFAKLIKSAKDIFTIPSGNLASTNLQDAINELDTEKLSLTGGTLTGPVASTSTFDGVDVSALPKIFVSISSDNDWDNEVVSIWQTPDGESVTITKITASTIDYLSASGTLAFNIEERLFGDINSTGIDICESEIIATSNGVSITTFNNSEIEANAYLIFTTNSSAVTGTVDQIAISIFYTVT